MTVAKIVRRWRTSFAAALLVAGCSLLAAPQDCRAVDLSGCWAGCWNSCTTGHHGPLYATFTRCDETNYHVTFSGKFFKIVPFRYSTVLTVVEDQGDKIKLAGSSYLGRMFGTFYYDAEATDSDFTANYSSCKDCGQFILSRCCHACNSGCGCQ